MLPIYVCEDDKKFLDLLKNMILKIIAEELEGKAKIMCAALNPIEILKLTEEDSSPALYFLDVDLGADVMSGIELGRNIRVINPGAYIVMVTAYADKAYWTYKYRINAKGYVLKNQIDEVEKSLREHIIDAYKALSTNQIEEQNIIAFCNNGDVRTKYADQIYYIEVIQDKRRKLKIHGKNEVLEINNMLCEIKKQLDASFFQCTRSHIVNMNHIKEINSETHSVIMKNGVKVPISFGRYKAFKKHYIEFLEKI
jgi:two-component system response regulator AgrA